MLKLPNAAVGFLLCILLLCLCYGGAPVMGDPDTAWHLAAGDLIRDHQAIPAADPWSFTTQGEKWYNLSWLFDAGFSALFALAGFSGIFALTVFVFALSITLMAWHCIRRGASPLAVFFVALLALFVILAATLARPHMVSVLLTVIFYLRLQSYRESGRFSELAWLPPIMALWVNLHGGFIFAFFIMGLFALDALLQGDVKRRRDYGVIMALCLAATLINPYGFGIYFGAYRTLSGAFDQTFILEWKPIEIGRNLPMTLLLFFILWGGNASDKRIAPVDRWLSVTVILLALASTRQAVIAALLVLPYLSLRLATLAQQSRFAARLRALDDTIAGDMVKKDIRVMALIMAAIALLLVALPMPRDAILKEPAGFPKDHFPSESAAFISQHYPHLRFFNDYNMGGYLVYLWRGSTKVFIDGRASSLYGNAVLEDYPDFAFTQGFGPKADRIASQYRLDGVIVLNDAPYASNWAWNPRWKLVHRDKVASVYLKNDSTPPMPAQPEQERKPTLLQKLKHIFSR